MRFDSGAAAAFTQFPALGGLSRLITIKLDNLLTTFRQLVCRPVVPIFGAALFCFLLFLFHSLLSLSIAKLATASLPLVTRPGDTDRDSETVKQRE